MILVSCKQKSIQTFISFQCKPTILLFSVSQLASWQHGMLISPKHNVGKLFSFAVNNYKEITTIPIE